MSVLVNYKICDNAAECGGIEVCPVGALFWNESEKKIGVDNNLCISCGKCEEECPIGAISVARNDKEYKEIKENIDKDKRTVEELFVERYGAMPIDDDCVLEQEQINELIKNNKWVFVEQFQDNSIQCLLHSIPILNIVKRYGCIYKKQQISGEEENYPRLLIYRNGQLLGQIDGYYEVDREQDFFNMIDKYI